MTRWASKLRHRQTWGDAVFSIGVAISLALIYWLASPATRTIFIYDATISYTDASGSTIPSWACFVCVRSFILYTINVPNHMQVPIAILLIKVGLVELALRNAHGWTMSAAFFIHFVLQGLYC